MAQDATIDGELDHDDVRERLPEVELIDDDELRAATVDAIARGFPDYFWQVPATSSGHYHNPFTRGEHGLWLHTKMVFTVFERTARSWVEQGLLTEREADEARAAILLHDMLKYGHGYAEGDSCVDNHDRLAGMWLSRHTSLPEQVVRAVERHNGPWYDGPAPDNHVEQAVHQADMVASTKNVTVGVYEPTERLAEVYPNLPRAEL